MGPGGAGGDKGEDLTGKVLHWDGNLLQWQTRTKTVIGAKAAWRHTAPLTETGAKERPVARQGVTANELETEQEKWDEKDAKALSIIQERVGPTVWHVLQQATTSRDAWERIEIKFKTMAEAQRESLVAQIKAVEHKNSVTIAITIPKFVCFRTFTPSHLY
jgi:hypothetical protein